MSAYEELLRFIEESRDRISETKANNRFGMRASDLAEERAMLTGCGGVRSRRSTLRHGEALIRDPY